MKSRYYIIILKYKKKTVGYFKSWRKASDWAIKNELVGDDYFFQREVRLRALWFSLFNQEIK